MSEDHAAPPPDKSAVLAAAIRKTLDAMVDASREALAVVKLAAPSVSQQSHGKHG